MHSFYTSPFEPCKLPANQKALGQHSAMLSRMMTMQNPKQLQPKGKWWGLLMNRVDSKDEEYGLHLISDA